MEGTTKFTIHRALSLVKTTQERLDKKINSKEMFICLRRSADEDINGEPIATVENRIKSNYDSIMSLFNNLVTLKCAIMRSNAGIRKNTEVKIAATIYGREMTVAEIIQYKELLKYKTKLLNVLENAWIKHVTAIENAKAQLEKSSLEYLKNAAIDEKSKNADSIMKIFKSENEPVSVNPLDLKTKIDALEKEIEDTLFKIDATLSEDNALTTISVDLQK